MESSVANTASVKEVNPAKTLSLNNLIFVDIIFVILKLLPKFIFK